MVTVALLQGAALALPAVVQPGPLQAFLLARSGAQGWRRTLPAAFAPLLTDGPILVVVLLVLTQFPPIALRVIGGLGGVFLLYLAVQALRGARRAGPVEVDADAGRRSLRDGIVVNLLNPLPYIFWSTVAGPLFLEARDHSAWAAGAFLLGFYGLFVTGLSVTIVVFASIGRIGVGVARTLGLIAAIALAAFGTFQIVRALSG